MERTNKYWNAVGLVLLIASLLCINSLSVQASSHQRNYPYTLESQLRSLSSSNNHALSNDLNTVTQIDANMFHTCTIATANIARCWGSNSHGQATPPADLGSVSQ